MAGCEARPWVSPRTGPVQEEEEEEEAALPARALHSSWRTWLPWQGVRDHQF